MKNSNNIFVGFKQEEIESSIALRFEWIVNQYPENIAIKINETQITYRQLNAKANQVARLIREKTKETEPICLVLEQNIQQFIGLIAILKTGNPWKCH